MIESNEASNSIRNYSLSWDSFEIYVLIFLLFCFFRILVLQKNKNIDRRLIQMYIISVVFLDVNYRIVSMQISELMAILNAVYDLYRRKFGIILNSLKVFMLTVLGIFFLSDIIAIPQGIYADSIYKFGNKVTLSYALGNCIRFSCIMYMVSKIIRELRDEDDIFSLMDWIRFGGQIVACVTILQVVFYVAGFTVSGVFYIAGMPRPKGLAHEPGPNAFVLLLPMVLSLFYVQRGLRAKRSACKEANTKFT